MEKIASHPVMSVAVMVFSALNLTASFGPPVPHPLKINSIVASFAQLCKKTTTKKGPKNPHLGESAPPYEMTAQEVELLNLGGVGVGGPKFLGCDQSVCESGGGVRLPREGV